MRWLCIALLLWPMVVMGTDTQVTVEDTHINDNSANTNYGNATTLSIDYSGSTRYRSLIRPAGIAAAIGAGQTISACSLFIYVHSENITVDTAVDVYEVFKPWVEGTCVAGDPVHGSDSAGATSNDWLADNSEWNTSFANCARDDGTYNSTDGGGVGCTQASHADRVATKIASFTWPSSGPNVWLKVAIPTALAQAWYAGTKEEEGVLLTTEYTTSNLGTFRSAEYGSETPYFKVTHSAVGGASTSTLHLRGVHVRSVHSGGN